MSEAPSITEVINRAIATQNSTSDAIRYVAAAATTLEGAANNFSDATKTSKNPEVVEVLQLQVKVLRSLEEALIDMRETNVAIERFIATT